MLLTDEDKAQAKELGLTHEEVRLAKAVRIPLERYAFHKHEIEAGRDAWDAKLSGMSDAMLERAAYFAPYGRGERPPLEGDA